MNLTRIKYRIDAENTQEPCRLLPFTVGRSITLEKKICQVKLVDIFREIRYNVRDTGVGGTCGSQDAAGTMQPFPLERFVFYSLRTFMIRRQRQLASGLNRRWLAEIRV